MRRSRRPQSLRQQELVCLKADARGLPALPPGRPGRPRGRPGARRGRAPCRERPSPRCSSSSSAPGSRSASSSSAAGSTCRSSAPSRRRRRSPWRTSATARRPSSRPRHPRASPRARPPRRRPVAPRRRPRRARPRRPTPSPDAEPHPQPDACRRRPNPTPARPKKPRATGYALLRRVPGPRQLLDLHGPLRRQPVHIANYFGHCLMSRSTRWNPQYAEARAHAGATRSGCRRPPADRPSRRPGPRTGGAGPRRVPAGSSGARPASSPMP